jgi:hypothetical protein
MNSAFVIPRPPSVGFGIYDAAIIGGGVAFVVIVAIIIAAAAVGQGEYRKIDYTADRRTAADALDKERARIAAVQAAAARRKLVVRADALSARLQPTMCDYIDQFRTAALIFSQPLEREMNLAAVKAYRSFASERRAADHPCDPPLVKPGGPAGPGAHFTYVAVKSVYAFLRLTITARGTISIPTSLGGARNKLPSLSARVISFADVGDTIVPTIRTGLRVQPLPLTDAQQGAASQSVPFKIVNGALSVNAGSTPLILGPGDVLQLFAVGFEEATYTEFGAAVMPDDFMIADPGGINSRNQPPPATGDISVEVA